MTDREQVIELVNKLSAEELGIVRELLARLAGPKPSLDELQAGWDAAGPDDEPVSDATAEDVAEALGRWQQDQQGVPHAEVKRRTAADGLP